MCLCTRDDCVFLHPAEVVFLQHLSDIDFIDQRHTHTSEALKEFPASIFVRLEAITQKMFSAFSGTNPPSVQRQTAMNTMFSLHQLQRRSPLYHSAVLLLTTTDLSCVAQTHTHYSSFVENCCSALNSCGLTGTSCRGRRAENVSSEFVDISSVFICTFQFLFSSRCLYG